MIRILAAAMRAAVVPYWLAEVVRPRPAALPRPEMIRAALAICVPLAAATALGQGRLGVLPPWARSSARWPTPAART